MERLTAEDRLMLWPDERWPQDMGALAILDGTHLLNPDGRFRIEAARQAANARLHLVRRFRQVLRVTEQLRRRRLDRSRPLWEMWFLTGLPERRIALFARMHHAIADGIAGMTTLATLLDTTPSAPAESARPWTPTPGPPTRALLADNLRRLRTGQAARSPPSPARRSQRVRFGPRSRRCSACSPHRRRRRPAWTRWSVPTADWQSSAATSNWPGRSRTSTVRRSTTSC